MNIVFMGTPDFAVPALEALASNFKITIKGVITQPDRPRGRGQKVYSSPVKKSALQLNLPIFQTSNVNEEDFLIKLNEFDLDFIIVVAFGQKLGEELLNIPKYGCVNLHASLLPEYRGSSPINKAIIDGKKVTGVTTMYMAEGWDTGDIIYQSRVDIKNKDTAETLHNKLSEEGAGLLVKTILDISKGTAPRIKQDDVKATYAYKMKKESGHIDWQRSNQEIFNLVRGVSPWPGAYTSYQKKLVKIWQVSPICSQFDHNISAVPGEIVAVSPQEGIIVKTGQGLLRIEELQLPGKKKTACKDFLRGYNIEKDEKLI